MNQRLIEQIDALLPQTQCRKCGFSGCRPYAEAITEGRADINQCPPGNQEGVQKLAELLGVPPKPLNTSFGLPRTSRVVAWIDERMCIGCTFCIQSCPVDAIVGAAKQLHTIITAECTGCELCIAPCPMDCIYMVPGDAIHIPSTHSSRLRYQFKLQRLQRETRTHRKPQRNKIIEHPEAPSTAAEARKKAIVQAAIQRATAIRNQTPNDNSST